MSTARKLQQTALILLIAAIVVTIAVSGLLPTPFGGARDQAAFLAHIFLWSAAGPLNYPFLWSASDLDVTTLVLLAGFVAVPAVLYYLWYTKSQAIALLGISTFLWTGFGGFSVLMAIAAGV